MQLYKHLTANNVKLEELKFHRELSMESYLIENSDVLILDNDELSEVSILEDELTLKQGRKSKDTDGRIDLLVDYGQNTFGVVELKLGTLTEIHLKQLEDYLKEKAQLEKYIEDNDFSEDTENIKWLGVLVGESIDKSLLEKIESGYLIEGMIPVAALTIKRYRGSDNQIYVLTETYFKNTSRNFDRTKYSFRNTTYGKGRLVHALIEKYVEDNLDTTFASLQKVFPKNIQGSMGVFTTIEDANSIFNRNSKRRHFIKPNEIISLKDENIAISSQWGIGNIQNILDKAVELGYKIKSL